MPLHDSCVCISVPKSQNKNNLEAGALYLNDLEAGALYLNSTWYTKSVIVVLVWCVYFWISFWFDPSLLVLKMANCRMDLALKAEWPFLCFQFSSYCNNYPCCLNTPQRGKIISPNETYLTSVQLFFTTIQADLIIFTDLVSISHCIEYKLKIGKLESNIMPTMYY